VLFPNSRNAYKEFIENKRTSQQPIATNTSKDKPTETDTSTIQTDKHQTNNDNNTIINVSFMNVQNTHKQMTLMNTQI
jgi:hypothetical protein